MDCSQFERTIANLQESLSQLQAEMLSMQMTITILFLVLGLLVIVTIGFLLYTRLLRSRVTALQQDNRELIRRLKIISESKIVN